MQVTVGDERGRQFRGRGEHREPPQGRAELYCGLLPEAERVPVSDNVSIVFFEAAGEAMVAVPVADKIKELRALGMQRCFQRALSRIADWSRRQSRETVSVIGGVHCQVAVMEATLIVARQQLCVDQS